MTYKYDFAVFIGRFQPFHAAHRAVIQQALTIAAQVIVVAGSAYSPRTLRNPFNFDERAQMILGDFSEEEAKRILVTPMTDVKYNDNSWTKNVQITVQSIISLHHFGPRNQVKVTLIGHEKDGSSYYLKIFPQWDATDVAKHEEINATDIRNAYFDYGTPPSEEVISKNVREIMHTFAGTVDYTNLGAERNYIRNYRKAWANTPYPVLFVTADGVVTQSGHILLIKRRAHPGKGMYAIPGGFVNANETLENSMLRELREETKLKVPEAVLRGNIKRVKAYDDPNRSERGRVITHAFHIDLPNQTELPKVKAASDAKEAFWMPLADLRQDNMFEDHFHIINDLLGLGVNNG